MALSIPEFWRRRVLKGLVIFSAERYIFENSGESQRSFSTGLGGEDDMLEFLDSLTGVFLRGVLSFETYFEVFMD